MFQTLSLSLNLLSRFFTHSFILNNFPSCLSARVRNLLLLPHPLNYRTTIYCSTYLFYMLLGFGARRTVHAHI